MKKFHQKIKINDSNFSYAFTLVELLMVVAIIGLLAFNVMISLAGAREKARIAAALRFEQNISHGLEPVGSYGLDEPTGATIAYDGSGLNSNGDINGTIVSVPGMRGSALSFNGDDYISLGDGTLDSLSQATVSLWFYYTGDFSFNRVFFSSYKDGGNRIPFFVAGWPGSAYDRKIVFEIIKGGAFSVGNLWSDKQITANKWYHAAVVCGAGSARMYVDGVQQSTVVSTDDCFSSIAPNANVEIGTHGTIAVYNFPGYIDEVRIYDKSLTSAQIQRLYAGSLLKFEMISKK